MDAKGFGEPISPLLTDRYLLTMCYSWMHSGKIDSHAVYEFFYRKNPFEHNFLVLCGINEAIDWLNRAKFSAQDIEYVRNDFNLKPEDPFLGWLAKVDFSKLTVNAIPEGSVVFPHCPLIIIEGPLGLVQLTETIILNKLNFPSLIATNARLMKRVIGKGDLLEFGLRRAQGPDGGLGGAYYACVGGAAATSNVLAGARYGVPTVGTMAHSFVTSFSELEDLDKRELSEQHKKFIKDCKDLRTELGLDETNDGELAAFISFALDFSNGFVALVDTYDSLNSGIPNFCVVAAVLERHGFTPKGFRLDSGDLAGLSLEGRKIMEKYGQATKTKIASCKIIASDDLSLKKIEAMKGKHSIDVFAVGTKLITCYEQAALGMVCKLCSLDSKPRMKFSDVPEKSTLPGKKQVWRLEVEKEGKTERCDLLAPAEQTIEIGTETTIFPFSSIDQPVKVKVISAKGLLEEVAQNPKNFEFDYLRSKQRVEESVNSFESLIGDASQKHPLYISNHLRDLLHVLRHELTLKH